MAEYIRASRSAHPPDTDGQIAADSVPPTARIPSADCHPGRSALNELAVNPMRYVNVDAGTVVAPTGAVHEPTQNSVCNEGALELTDVVTMGVV